MSASAGPNEAEDPRAEADRRIAALGGTLEGTLIRRLGIEVLEAGPDRVVARMPVAGNVQPFGLLHGGATAALCETVGSVGASLAFALVVLGAALVPKPDGSTAPETNTPARLAAA